VSGTGDEGRREDEEGKQVEHVKERCCREKGGVLLTFPPRPSVLSLLAILPGVMGRPLGMDGVADEGG
jgi:hypothetical protein